MITRINSFNAKEGSADSLRHRLVAAIPTIRNTAGCMSCELLHAEQAPGKFLVIETWENIAAHQQAVRAIPRETFAQVMPLLAGPPSGEYFITVERR